MLRIASTYLCIIVLQKGQRLGFPYSFKSQLCTPGIFCFCTISRVGCVLQARGGFPSPWPENVLGSFCCLVYCDSEGFVILVTCEQTEQDSLNH
uniref:Uncharacterized protein n=1 Tax=Populus trichocarpa TaxID=3694 RepID=A0A2K2AFE7_POPTR